ncbi:PAS domain-containing protein [Acerihabitans sp. TG2]|uniref:PAS domain-containing protein n=1 Tax=Acerihabitans sp. TG2 TaxID=3096008 RepID=UPI002B22EADD|nr:PAS domain-containing protein [Acerihabitans sp. TG2]MEA9389095.1 PAS domain-containing protein [Acerihabitans sp. TG2]
MSAINSSEIIPEIELPLSVTKLFDQMHYAFAIRNLEGRLIYGNPAYLEFLCLKSKNEIVGKFDKDVKAQLFESNEVTEEFAKQYRRVCQGEKTFATLELHPQVMGYPYIFKKTPYKNKEGKCIGIIGNNDILKTNSLNDYVKGNMSGSLLLNKPDDFFTERQCEIFFYLLQGLKVKEVAIRLNLSVNTVNNYMQTLYDMTGSRNLDDFKAFCEQRNYHRYLPKRFLESEAIIFGRLIM